MTPADKKIPLVDLKAQYATIRDSIDQAIGRVIDNCSFILGPEAAAFEKEFAAYCGLARCVGCGNGTEAISLALQALGVGPGDEVIVPSYTFIATAEAVTAIGARVVMVDVGDKDLLIDPEKVEAAVTPKTKAVLPVHLYGQMADMDAIAAIAARHRLHVVEDAAQAHGASFKGRKPGQGSRAVTFSFYPGKNLGAYGDAGAIATDDVDLANRLAKSRNHGRDDKYRHDFEGWNSRLDGMQAAVLRAKLPHLPGWTAARRRLAARYDELLAGVEGVRPLGAGTGREHVYHLYVVRVANGRRDAVLKALKQRGIESGVHYPIPLHMQPAYAYLGLKPEDLPVCHRAAQEVLSLPLYPEMKPEDLDYVAAALKEVLKEG